jgi:hypothetical protein
MFTRTIVFVVAFALAGPAAADLLRCKAADGRMIYTDNPALCPGAKPFEPKGAIQTAPSEASKARESAPAARLERARARERSAAAQEGEALRWKQRKVASEQELETIQARREEIREFVTWCNRGNVVTTRDASGIKRTVPCSEIRKEFGLLDEREARVRHYLENELAEECRRAGCLPGWLR